jgi:putative RNA 2'-phosphotransferase
MKLELDEAGWVAVDALLVGFAARGTPLTKKELEEIVRTSDKQRFALSDDGLRIRASQGHSVEVELGYAPKDPPAILFHGTVAKFLDANGVWLTERVPPSYIVFPAVTPR